MRRSAAAALVLLLVLRVAPAARRQRSAARGRSVLAVALSSGAHEAGRLAREPPEPKERCPYDNFDLERLSQPWAKSTKVSTSLHSGAFGSVCKARIACGSRSYDVALKRISGRETRSASPGALLRIHRELHFMGLFDHPRLAKLFAYDASPMQLSGGAYLAMELFERDLFDEVMDARQAERDVDPKAMIKLMHDVLTGLQVLHGAGVVHNDVKLENIFLDSAGDAAIGDFGAACATGRDEHPCRGPTQSEWRWPGTVFTSPPEFWANLSNVPDPKWDIWAAGVMLHMLYTLERPFVLPFEEVPNWRQVTDEQAQSNLAELRTYGERMAERSSELLRRKNLQDYLMPGELLIARLLNRMVELDPDSRCSADECLAIISSGGPLAPSSEGRAERNRAIQECFHSS